MDRSVFPLNRELDARMERAGLFTGFSALAVHGSVPFGAQLHLVRAKRLRHALRKTRSGLVRSSFHGGKFHVFAINVTLSL